MNILQREVHTNVWSQRALKFPTLFLQKNIGLNLYKKQPAQCITNDRPSENKTVEIFRLAQIKSFIQGFHFSASDKKIVEAARKTFIRISAVTFARERVKGRFQFSTWVWKGG